MSTFCRGTIEGEPCECEEYSPPANPDPSQPVRCEECHHGKSKHPKPNGLTGAPTKATTVRDIFTKITTRETPKSTPSEARSETMEGFRKTSGSSSKSVTASKGKESSAKASKGSSKWVRVASVVVIVCGINAAGELKRSKAPSKIDLSRMEARGCAKVSGDYDEEIMFDSSWTHEEVDAFLRNLLPTPFQYVDNLPSTARRGPKSLWVLLFKENKRLSVVAKQASGKDLLRYKGRDKCGAEDSHIFIALRATVPQEVYNSWAEGSEFSEMDTDEKEESDDEPEDNFQLLTKGKGVKRQRDADSEAGEVVSKQPAHIKKKFKTGFEAVAVVNGMGASSTSKLFITSDSEVDATPEDQKTIPVPRVTATKVKPTARLLVSRTPRSVPCSETAALRMGNAKNLFREIVEESRPNPWSPGYSLRQISF